MKRLLLVALVIPALGSFAAAAPSSSISVKVTTTGRVVALAADGDRAAVIVARRGSSQVIVWDRNHRRAVPIHRIDGLDCSTYCGPRGSLAVAGRLVSWDEASGGNTLETTVSSASLAHRAPLSLGAGTWDFSFDGSGDEAFAPTGDGRLLAFTIQTHCADPEGDEEPRCPPGREAGDVVSARVWRVARHGRCPTYRDYYPAGHCALVAKANGELTVLAVDAGRIAARTDDGVRLMTGRGRRLRDFPVEDVRAAELSADRLALRVPGAVEIYDTGSGRLVTSFPVGGSARLDRLEDLERGVLVTAMGKTVTLHRLRDGRKATIQMRGTAYAQLEPAGLFVAGGHRLTFTPMRDVLRKLGRAPSTRPGSGR
jgi:hypothetical protein